jgi:succinate dehydrogenase / fumarate reductase iron-sulfur subunit
MPGQTTDKTSTDKHGHVKPGRLPVSEILFDRPGAPSPFGEDVIFPVPSDRLAYEPPESPEPEKTEQY